MHPLAETLLDEPVIAAVKTDEALTAALASPCSAVFLLASTLLTVDGLVHRIHDAGKLAVVHIDLVDGLSSREIAVDSLNALCHPDGIISTRPTLHPPGAPPRPADRPAGIHPGFPLADQPVRSAGAGQAGFCRDPSRHHAPGHRRDQRPHTGACHCRRPAAGQSRRHGRHARRCRRSFHLCALPVGYLSQNKIPAEVRKA
mgnify:CR=1 FL=1